jgi:FkbM family methyltransferase
MLRNLVAFTVLACVQLNAFEIVEQSKETEGLGFGEWNIAIDGESALMHAMLKPNDLVLDVGGNHGEWSTYALRAQPSIRIMAFEPVPPVFADLQANLGGNGNVQLFNYALSDKTGTASFHYYPEADGLSGFYYREVLRGDHPDPHVIEVAEKTLDLFCKENGINEIGFVKIDTEGAEWKILQGARDLIENRKIRAIQFEYGGCYIDAKTTLKDVAQFLTTHGYLIFRIVPKGLVHIAKWESSLENYHLSNYFALRREELPGYKLMD